MYMSTLSFKAKAFGTVIEAFDSPDHSFPVVVGQSIVCDLFGELYVRRDDADTSEWSNLDYEMSTDQGLRDNWRHIGCMEDGIDDRIKWNKGKPVKWLSNDERVASIFGLSTDGEEAFQALRDIADLMSILNSGGIKKGLEALDKLQDACRTASESPIA